MKRFSYSVRCIMCCVVFLSAYTSHAEIVSPKVLMEMSNQIEATRSTIQSIKDASTTEKLQANLLARSDINYLAALYRIAAIESAIASTSANINLSEYRVNPDSKLSNKKAIEFDIVHAWTYTTLKIKYYKDYSEAFGAPEYGLLSNQLNEINSRIEAQMMSIYKKYQK